MSYINSCRICNKNDLIQVIDLGKQPWGNNFLNKNEIGNEKYYPLVLLFCNDCKVAQLNFTVKKEIMFGDHTYLSGTTSSLSNHFKDLRDEIIEKFSINSKKKILDIGSNDGTFLKHFKDIGWEILGVESSKKTFEIAVNNKINTINKFFNYEAAEEIDKKFDFINASGVFFHLEELHSFTKGVEFLLKDDGVFIIQFLYMNSIIKNTAFDQIYHEHLLYYNLRTLENLLEIYNLEIFDAKLHEIHGGQMTAYVSKKNKKKKTKKLIKLLSKEDFEKSNNIKNYLEFEKNIKLLKNNNLEFIKKYINKKKKIFVLGAPVKGNTLLNYFGLNKNHISKLLEINSLRKGLFAPGSHIPIEMENEIKEQPDIYYVLAWNFKKEILKKNEHLLKKGVQFYFPINAI